MKDNSSHNDPENGGSWATMDKDDGRDGTVSTYQGGKQEEKYVLTQPEMHGTASVNLFEIEETLILADQPDPPLETFYACSLFVLLFCCLPFGIVALVYASKQRSRTLKGDLEEARRYQPLAKKWSYIGFFTGVVIILINVLWSCIVYLPR